MSVPRGEQGQYLRQGQRAPYSMHGILKLAQKQRYLIHQLLQFLHRYVQALQSEKGKENE